MLAILLSACGTTPPPSSPDATAAVIPSHTANEVLFRALGLVGVPYKWGGNTPAGGFDCSGLIVFVYRDTAQINLPRTTRAMLAMPATAVKADQLIAGDLVFFATNGSRSVNHAGIYVGEGRFVHAPSKGGTVRLDHLSNSYWQRAYLAGRRILPP